jgi:hypothetical protein
VSPPPPDIEAPGGSVMVTVTWPLGADPVSLTWNTTVPELPDWWPHTLTVAVSCTAEDGVGVGSGGLCVEFGLALSPCDVTPDAECEVLGAGLPADLEGDADWTGVVTLGDPAASA